MRAEKTQKWKPNHSKYFLLNIVLVTILKIPRSTNVCTDKIILNALLKELKPFGKRFT